ncbi:hypothetical protein B7463_g5233, partial [Scytalidium lignicola]
MALQKVALITGASKGVGAAVARALATDMRIVINHRSDSAAAEALVEELRKLANLDLVNGVFIATASVAGVKPSGSSLPYAVTKAALIHLIRSLAVISAPKVRVNSVSPGVLLTDWGPSIPRRKAKGYSGKKCIKEICYPESKYYLQHLENITCSQELTANSLDFKDVAGQVRALAMSRSITGVNVVIDAGFSL